MWHSAAPFIAWCCLLNTNVLAGWTTYGANLDFTALDPYWRLNAWNSPIEEQFGNAVAISDVMELPELGDLQFAIIGSVGSQKAYVFSRCIGCDKQWDQSAYQELKNPNHLSSIDDSTFGYSVAITTDIAVVGG